MKKNFFDKIEYLKDKEYENNSQNISTRMFYPYKPLFVEIIFVFFRFLGFLCCINAFSIEH